MDWTPVSYAYDGSFAGFLTCVFASYAHREEPMSSVSYTHLTLPTKRIV